jgi:hypothetical protein
MKIWTLSSMLGALLLMNGCGADSGASALCEDPTGGYTAFINWTFGDCVVTDGYLSIQVTDSGSGWVASAGGAEGYASITTGGADGCYLQVDLFGAEVDYSFGIFPDGDRLSGFGNATVYAADGSTCTHYFDLVELEWTP